MARDIDAPELFSYVFVWFALSDACPKCQALNGREYRGQDLFQPVLEDPEFGPVWDLEANESLVHPNCRCHLMVNVSVNLGEWSEYQELSDTLTRYF